MCRECEWKGVRMREIERKEKSLWNANWTEQRKFRRASGRASRGFAQVLKCENVVVLFSFLHLLNADPVGKVSNKPFPHSRIRLYKVAFFSDAAYSSTYVSLTGKNEWKEKCLPEAEGLYSSHALYLRSRRLALPYIRIEWNLLYNRFFFFNCDAGSNQFSPKINSNPFSSLIPNSVTLSRIGRWQRLFSTDFSVFLFAVQ